MNSSVKFEKKTKILYLGNIWLEHFHNNLLDRYRLVSLCHTHHDLADTRSSVHKDSAYIDLQVQMVYIAHMDHQYNPVNKDIILFPLHAKRINVSSFILLEVQKRKSQMLCESLTFIIECISGSIKDRRLISCNW